MTEYTTRALSEQTWDDFATLATKHNGVWGGCWCTSFHPRDETRQRFDDGRSYKHYLVREGRAHAALVFDGETCVAWCQFGTPTELPRIYHRKQYEAGETRAAEYRITCFFIDRDHRRNGLAAVALRGALDLIAQAGGGYVVALPKDTQGKKTSASFLYNGTPTMFTKAGFEYERPIGKNHCVMHVDISTAAASVATSG